VTTPAGGYGIAGQGFPRACRYIADRGPAAVVVLTRQAVLEAFLIKSSEAYLRSSASPPTSR